MIAGLKCRSAPDPEWMTYPQLILFHTYLQTDGRLLSCTATTYATRLIQVSKATGLSLDELAGCDVDSTVDLGYPDRLSGALKQHRSAVRRWQSFRGVPA